MKILCTGDWHIGKKLERFSRMEEQEDVLKQIIAIAESEQVDAVLIAGDCFDNQTPSPEMAKLFVKTLASLSRGGECPVLVISGNHDNPMFLSASEAFASQVGVAILGFPNEIPYLENIRNPWQIVYTAPGVVEIFFKKSKRNVRFLLTPYANAQRLKKDLGTHDVDQKAWEILCSQWKQNISHEPHITNILVTHQFLLPEKNDLYQENPHEDTEERSIVGTIGAISLDHLPEGIDYTIAGHIHKPQMLYSSKTRAFYTGSPLIYSSSEKHQQKSVLILELGRKNTEYRIELDISRDIKEIRFDSFDTIFDMLEQEQENYLVLIWEGSRYCTSEERQQLYTAHPRIIRIESQPKIKQELDISHDIDKLQKQTPIELFEEYFRSKKNGSNPGEDLISVFQECISEEQSTSPLSRKQGFLPKTLKIQGFYSYKELVYIDFSALEEKRFFGIFGAVGSGKSALIEAMIFALFGKIERLGSMKGGSSSGKEFSVSYAMTNLESKELLIEFSFEIFGENGLEEYLCRINGKRDKKKFANITLKREFFIKKNNEWEPLDHNNGELLLGITYADFRKTIILQQRDFLGFLNATPADNSETLMRLFQLERFDLAKQADLLGQKISGKFYTLQNELQHLESISLDKLDQLQEQFEELQTNHSQDQQELKDIETQLQQKKQICEKIERFSSLKVQSEQIQPQKETFNQAKIRRNIQQLINYDLNISERTRELIEVQESKKYLETKVASDSREYTILKQLEQEYSEKSVLSKQELDSIQIQWEEGLTHNFAEQIQSLEYQIKEYNRIDCEIDTLNKKITEASHLVAAKDQFLEEGTLLKQQQGELSKSAGLAPMLKYLHDGEACPLCGSLDHPHPYTDIDLDLAKKLEETGKKLEETREKYKDAERASKYAEELGKEQATKEVLKKECLGIFTNIEELVKECERLKQEQEKHRTGQTQIKLKLDSNKKQINELEEVLKNTQEKCINYEKSAERNTAELKNADSNITRITKELEKLTIFKTEEFERLNLNESQYLEIQSYPIKSDSEIEAFFEEYRSIEKEYNTLVQSDISNINYEETVLQIKELEQEKDSRTEKCQENLKALGAIKLEIEQTKQALEQKKVFEERFTNICIRQDNINILKSLFKGRGFVSFIGQKYLHRLCHTANKRFMKFTRNQFELSPPQDIEKRGITLIDHLSGGNKRDTATLSGGQSFQAALALALALADESGAGHRFFFIDEGFGSLDDETLTLVLENLFALTEEEKRIVGLISHIPAIKDEVLIYLDVVRDQVNGTKITWENK